MIAIKMLKKMTFGLRKNIKSGFLVKKSKVCCFENRLINVKLSDKFILLLCW